MQLVICGKTVRDLGFLRLLDKVELAWEMVNRTEGLTPPTGRGPLTGAPRTHVGKRVRAKKC